MPDVSSAPAIGPPTGLYPQPPQQQPALSGNPAQMLDLLGKINQNYQLQQELKARAAIGQAYQGALQPDGTFDPNRLSAGLRNPDAAWALPETMSHFLQQQGAQFANLSAQRQWIIDRLGALADKSNLSAEDVRHFVVDGARDAGISPLILEGFKRNILDGNPSSKELTNRAQTARMQAIGSAGLAARVPGPPTAAGATTSTSLGQTVAAPGAMPTGQPPGQPELQQASAASAARLEASANTTSQYHADLDNLRQLSKDIPLQGPTAEFEKKLNQVTTRLGFGATMTADQLAKSEEFAKIASQIALNQSSLFHGSDAGLQMNVSANPNLEISRYGREGVISMLQGNQDALDTLRKLWFNAKRGYKKDTGQELPANTYNDFVQEASDGIHPRVFQFMRMNPEAQAKFLDGVSDKTEFERQLTDADRRGWIKLPKGPQTAPEARSGLPALKTGAAKNAGRMPQGEPAAAPPEEAAAPPKPPIPGVKLGRHTDGSPRWYIEDQARPGKFLEVRQPFPGMGQ